MMPVPPGPAPGPAMHARLTIAAEDAAVVLLQEAAAILCLVDPVQTAMRADSDPGAIGDIAANVGRRKSELDEAHNDLVSAVGILMRAWRGQRHDNWNSHANDALEYYQPAGLGRGKPGVLARTDKSAKAASSIGNDLDKATSAVADGLIARATEAQAASQAVVSGAATDEDVAEVTMAVNAVVDSVRDFGAKVEQMTDKYLVAPNLDSTLPFPQPSGDAGPASVLYIDDEEFAKGVEKLDSSAALAGMASEGLNAVTGITSTGGRSPFGDSPSAILLEATWMMTVTSRSEEAGRLRDVTLRLKESAEQAWQEFHEVDRRNAETFDGIRHSLDSNKVAALQFVGAPATVKGRGRDDRTVGDQ
ncbi:hypothetical protein [Kutzneria buriramensis]|uniref:Uncharacterized protein n=1 Tax=Kutzneria buriramensis TaxID=1045776 RepID=A0A3E0HLG4_9PSEU|nr:hypothetical protein [Kutzneria buriramensis]REH47304.1 hypothetical protein BCF44_106469 [Kutzneria buriramensis]